MSDPSSITGPVRVVDLASGDTATVRTVLAGLSADSRYRRFQSSRPMLPAPLLAHLATVRPPDQLTHAALLDGEPVGLIHWIRLPGTRDAEVACEVVDRAQGRGIGTALFRRAAQSAADCGIDGFVAHMFIGDPRLLNRAIELGSTPDRSEPGRFRLPVEVAATVS